MSEFTTIEQLNKAFMSGSFKLDQTVIVEGTTYTLFESSPISIVESIQGKNPIAVYTSDNPKLTLLFAWHVNSRNALQPSGVAEMETLDAHLIRDEQFIVEVDGDKITIRPDQLIGDLARVSFTGLSNPKEIHGKVDTGATISSLHADHYKINGNQITFTCQPISSNAITVPLKTQHAVKSADGGTVYRPVVELDVKVNGKLINGAEFNLNDRSHMDQPVLIGQNVLQAGKFYIDTSIKESIKGIDWEYLQETANIIPMLHHNANEDQLNEFYKFMMQSDVTFQDLVRHIRHEVIKTFDDIE